MIGSSRLTFPCWKMFPQIAQIVCTRRQISLQQRAAAVFSSFSSREGQRRSLITMPSESRIAEMTKLLQERTSPYSCLQDAVEAGDARAAFDFLKKPTTSGERETALKEAAKQGNDRIVQLLLIYKAPGVYDALEVEEVGPAVLEALENGHEKTAIALFNAVRSSFGSNASRWHGLWLSAAARQNLVRFANLCIPASSVGDRYRALEEAARCGSKEAVEFLLSEGNLSSPHYASERGSAMVRALENGHEALAFRILEKGALDPSLYRVGLFLAAEKNYVSFVYRMLQQSWSDKDLRTAARLAREKGNHDIDRIITSRRTALLRIFL